MCVGLDVPETMHECDKHEMIHKIMGLVVGSSSTSCLGSLALEREGTHFSRHTHRHYCRALAHDATVTYFLYFLDDRVMSFRERQV